jgi:hypothetical protein
MVISHNFYFLLAIGVFCAVLLAITGYYFLVARRSAQAGWQDILAKLTWIDRQMIAEVALDEKEGGESGLMLESGGPELEPGELWKMLGGMEGLEIMERNSKVLIELACYLQRWYPEALPIAEQLRLDSRALQWHVSRLKGAAGTGNLEISFPFYAQRAASTYYVMTRRVLALYEATNFAHLPELQRAI